MYANTKKLPLCCLFLFDVSMWVWVCRDSLFLIFVAFFVLSSSCQVSFILLLSKLYSYIKTLSFFLSLFVCVILLLFKVPIQIRKKKKMRVLAIALVLMFVSAVAAEQCHPNCKWQCDDPQCPAVCHPVCEKPNCQMQCEETPCAKCTIHCAQPVCTIRCPKETCEKEGCPKCEHVCKPAQCHVSCEAPEPKCSPVCEELNCQHKCAKPTNCQKPKCELQCEKSACEAQEPKCCPCNTATTQVAVTQANNACNSSPCQQAAKPSFLEVMHGIMHKEQVHGEEQCCPCNQ
jgi:hypothetical protein